VELPNTWGTNISATNKKQKKSAITKNAAQNALDPGDHAALNRRAARFKREHEIERQKNIHSSALSFHPPSQYHHTRGNTTSGFMHPDDPEADPVRLRKISVYHNTERFL
jgi:SAC3 family protein LENG8/THP3